MPSLLLIDDDPILLANQMNHIFGSSPLNVSVARSGIEGLRLIENSKPDVVLLDVTMPDMSGLEVYQRMRQHDARIPVIFITGTSTAESAIEAMRQGAYDYLFKPVDLRQLEKVVGEALELGRRMRQPASFGMAQAADDGDSIIGKCPGMREVYKAIGRVADQKLLVLITGESGTGKELVARAIYQHSDRSKAPFLAINCAAIPENLLESELFGHEKGAFAGADRRRIGKFEQCNGGTIFLDEIGDMPLSTQGKILRLLQDQKFERVGGNQTIQTDVRLIAATNRDLKLWSEAGKFRPDLYYRLSVFTIPLPPLRERGDDLELLANFYVRRFNRELAREIQSIAPTALEQLRRHTWPGNVRELQSVLKQALLRAQGTILTPEFLPAFGKAAAESPKPTATNGEFCFEDYIKERLMAGSNDLHAEVHLQLDRILLPAALRWVNGNQLHAAKILGIARQTLRNRLRELGLSITKSIEGREEKSANTFH
jgi:two-component system nitrogen regulation response regulator GlnG